MNSELFLRSFLYKDHKTTLDIERIKKKKDYKKISTNQWLTRVLRQNIERIRTAAIYEKLKSEELKLIYFQKTLQILLKIVNWSETNNMAEPPLLQNSTITVWNSTVRVSVTYCDSRVLYRDHSYVVTIFRKFDTAYHAKDLIITRHSTWSRESGVNKTVRSWSNSEY